MITCRTPDVNSTAITTADVLIQYDGGTTRPLTPLVFTYYDNPVVNDVTPSNSYRR